jgi:hypothetical protein
MLMGGRRPSCWAGRPPARCGAAAHCTGAPPPATALLADRLLRWRPQARVHGRRGQSGVLEVICAMQRKSLPGAVKWGVKEEEDPANLATIDLLIPVHR